MSWELHNGKIPIGLCVLHECDNPLCVNPKHLFLGTRATNNRDRANKGRSADLSGSKNPRAKLSDDQVDYIRLVYQRRSKGSNNLEGLAKMFNVDKSTISNVVLKKHYRDAK